MFDLNKIGGVGVIPCMFVFLGNVLGMWRVMRI